MLSEATDVGKQVTHSSGRRGHPSGAQRKDEEGQTKEGVREPHIQGTTKLSEDTDNVEEGPRCWPFIF